MMNAMAKTSLALAAMLTLGAGAAAAQGRDIPGPRDYYNMYQPAGATIAASRADRIDFDLSGERGRNGLGADPVHPEGSGNFVD